MPGEVHGRQLYIIMGGVMLGLLLAALDQTVVGPAMFRIVSDLQGLEHYAWVTTAYLLTSTVTVPIAGKIGDLFGRNAGMPDVKVEFESPASEETIQRVAGTMHMSNIDVVIVDNGQ